MVREHDFLGVFNIKVLSEGLCLRISCSLTKSNTVLESCLISYTDFLNAQSPDQSGFMVNLLLFQGRNMKLDLNSCVLNFKKMGGGGGSRNKVLVFSMQVFKSIV